MSKPNLANSNNSDALVHGTSESVKTKVEGAKEQAKKIGQSSATELTGRLNKAVAYFDKMLADAVKRAELEIFVEIYQPALQEFKPKDLTFDEAQLRSEFPELDSYFSAIDSIHA